CIAFSGWKFLHGDWQQSPPRSSDFGSRLGWSDNRMKSLPLHRAPLLPAAQEFPESAHSPVNGQLAISHVLEQRPPEKKHTIAERVVAVETQILENEGKRCQRRAQTICSEIKQSGESPIHNAKGETKHEREQSEC